MRRAIAVGVVDAGAVVYHEFSWRQRAGVISVATPSREDFPRRAKPGYPGNMAKSMEPELPPPTEQQKKPVSNVVCLLHYCEALGVDWDSKILPRDTWEIDEPRYVDLHMKVIEALYLYDKLGLPIPASPYWSFALPASPLEVTLSYKDLIDLGRRAGWIPQADA